MVLGFKLECVVEIVALRLKGRLAPSLEDLYEFTHERVQTKGKLEEKHFEIDLREQEMKETNDCGLISILRISSRIG